MLTLTHYLRMSLIHIALGLLTCLVALIRQLLRRSTTSLRENGIMLQVGVAVSVLRARLVFDPFRLIPVHGSGSSNCTSNRHV